jgi:hypothetical protein
VVSSEGSGSDCADETKSYRPEGQKHTGLTDPEKRRNGWRW